jgi:hypothetical protein
MTRKPAHSSAPFRSRSEESSKDQDYYINETTVDLFEQRGADAGLVRLLRGALKGRSEMEIRWSRS